MTGFGRRVARDRPARHGAGARVLRVAPMAKVVAKVVPLMVVALSASAQVASGARVAAPTTAPATPSGSAPAAGAPSAPVRVLPPTAVDCPRDRLTLYAGRVLVYRRTLGRTELRLRTEWDTTEAVVLSHPGSNDPSRWFLIERAPFTAADWARIETAPGRLRPGLRAAAWVCDDGRAPIVDWILPAR